MECPRCKYYNRRIQYVPLQSKTLIGSVHDLATGKANDETFKRGFKCCGCSYVWTDSDLIKKQKKQKCNKLEQEINAIKTMGYKKGPYKTKEKSHFTDAVNYTTFDTEHIAEYICD